MVLISNINERRKEFRGRLVSSSRQLNPDAGMVIRLSDIDGIEHVDEAYINKRMLERVHRRIANDMVAGKSRWPVETSLSQKGFRGNIDAIVNTVDYAPFVETMHEHNRRRGYKVPTSFPSTPARRYVIRKWAEYAVDDIARTRRIRG